MSKGAPSPWFRKRRNSWFVTRRQAGQPADRGPPRSLSPLARTGTPHHTGCSGRSQADRPGAGCQLPGMGREAYPQLRLLFEFPDEIRPHGAAKPPGGRLASLPSYDVARQARPLGGPTAAAVPSAVSSGRTTGELNKATSTSPPCRRFASRPRAA